MDDASTMITAGMLASAVIELIKWIWRRFVVKNMEFDFSPMFYAVAIPVLSYVCEIPLAILGMGEYNLPTDWRGWAMKLVAILVASLISMATHQLAFKPMKAKVREYRLTR